MFVLVAQLEREHLPTKQGVAGSSPAGDAMKVLVTGDREWDDYETIMAALSRYPTGTILINGACRGADVICGATGEALGFVVRYYPADWDRFLKAAGPIRNSLMLTLEHLPEEPFDVCLAFHNNIGSSRGTKDMKEKAEKAGIPTELITSSTYPRSSVE